jgi:hypothetical protein
METKKSIFASRTIWSSIVLMFSLMINKVGIVSILPNEVDVIVNGILAFIEIISAILVIYFRIVAEKRLI